MTKKRFSLVLVFLLALFITTPALAAKTYRADSFDAQLDLQPGGDLLVTETVQFRFEGGPFTFAFREISANGTDGLTFIDASLDGAPMPRGTAAGQVEVQNGDPLKVTWHFSPATDETHVFVVRYRVKAVVTTGAADNLAWFAIPPDHGYAIANATISLNYVAGVQPLAAPGLNRRYDSVPTSTGIRLTASGIAADESVILSAEFPAHSLAAAAPQWQVRRQAADAATARNLPLGFLSGLATLLLGGFGLFSYIRANRRQLNLSARTLLPNPPADLPPAVAGKLTGKSGVFMGTIFDLAQRGLLEVRDEKGFLGATNHILERQPLEISLTPHEQDLLQAIFKPGETRVSLSEVGNRLAYKSAQLDQPLEQELIQQGWLDPERKQKRKALLAAGYIALLAGLTLFMVGVAGTVLSLRSSSALLGMLAAILAGLGAGTALFSIPLLIYAGTFSMLTSAGEEQKIRWDSFRSYLDQVSRGREPAIRPDTFETYLPYAAAFGLGSTWAKYFQTLGGVPLPVWFRARTGSDGDFSALVAVMSASDSAASSAGADGGGAGASGGGSSGAG